MLGMTRLQYLQTMPSSKCPVTEGQHTSARLYNNEVRGWKCISMPSCWHIYRLKRQSAVNMGCLTPHLLRIAFHFSIPPWRSLQAESCWHWSLPWTRMDTRYVCIYAGPALTLTWIAGFTRHEEARLWRRKVKWYTCQKRTPASWIYCLQRI